MKFRQEFRVPENIEKVWLFFEQPLSVAKCIPGVETAEELDGDSFTVRATQKLGPMSAIFDARIRITNRVHKERIEFGSTGKAVRGAAGNFRTQNAVILTPAGEETDVVVEGEAALAGVLGTIGHTVINKQAAKVTAAFARNLEQALSEAGNATAGVIEPTDAKATPTPAARTVESIPRAQDAPARPSADPWTKAAAILSGAATIIGLVILIRMSL
jgi:carbon monoxide dehydrogenase subunit G